MSLTDHFAKVAESFITDWLMEDIEMQIDDGQFGNRKAGLPPITWLNLWMKF